MLFQSSLKILLGKVSPIPDGPCIYCHYSIVPYRRMWFLLRNKTPEPDTGQMPAILQPVWLLYICTVEPLELWTRAGLLVLRPSVTACSSIYVITGFRNILRQLISVKEEKPNLRILFMSESTHENKNNDTPSSLKKSNNPVFKI